MRTIADKIETIISQYPLIQYAFCATSELVFSEKVRHICETECERYGKSWSCPPGVGEVEECRKRCQDYDRVLLYTTQAEVTDSSIFSEALASRTSHEEITREMLKEFREAGISCFALSGDSCQICSKCAYPDSCQSSGYGDSLYRELWHISCRSDGKISDRFLHGYAYGYLVWTDFLPGKRSGVTYLYQKIHIF
ncbi:MAG: DUF2284 domain-containing protein [Lachnospiraceae bacterium]